MAEGWLRNGVKHDAPLFTRPSGWYGRRHSVDDSTFVEEDDDKVGRRKRESAFVEVRQIRRKGWGVKKVV